MLFNSVEYLVFFIICFCVYWFFLKEKTKMQNLFLLTVSYVFYGWWDYRFLSLIIVSSLLDYLIGIRISESQSARNKKIFLAISLAVNLGFLGVFKYYDFFVVSFTDMLASVGINEHIRTINVILPVGISFYTFQTLSYSIDIYRKNIKPCKDIIAFFAFVTFFPQLVAGPIERAANLLPQFLRKRNFDYHQAILGCRQILWGFFKKVVVADNCAILVDCFFENYSEVHGPILFLGAAFFAFQIYCDFSGYSDIAVGTSRLFGFNLMQNFAYPYFSRDIAEFWRRWHISLTTWFRDYIYIPLGGSKVGRIKMIRNVFIIFSVSGIWHGANWTFVIWGFINALLFVPLMLSQRNRKNLGEIGQGKIFPSVSEISNVILTFILVCFTWVFFRAESLIHASTYLSHLFSFEISSPMMMIKKLKIEFSVLLQTCAAITVLLVVEWTNRAHSFGLEVIRGGRAIRFIIYILLTLVVLEFFSAEQDFIYFQF